MQQLVNRLAHEKVSKWLIWVTGYSYHPQEGNTGNGPTTEHLRVCHSIPNKGSFPVHPSWSGTTQTCILAISAGMINQFNLKSDYWYSYIYIHISNLIIAFYV